MPAMPLPCLKTGPKLLSKRMAVVQGSCEFDPVPCESACDWLQSDRWPCSVAPGTLEGV